MNLGTFNAVVNSTPIFYAVFRVIKVPIWINETSVSVGELLYWNNQRQELFKIRNSMPMTLTPDCLEFISYQDADTMTSNAKETLDDA